MLKSECVQTTSESSEKLTTSESSEKLTIREVIEKFVSSIDNFENFEINEKNEFLLRYIFSFHICNEKFSSSYHEKLMVKISIKTKIVDYAYDDYDYAKFKVVKKNADVIEINFNDYNLFIFKNELTILDKEKNGKEEMNEIIKKVDDKMKQKFIREKKLCKKVKELLKHKDDINKINDIFKHINFKELFDNNSKSIIQTSVLGEFLASVGKRIQIEKNDSCFKDEYIYILNDGIQLEIFLYK